MDRKSGAQPSLRDTAEGMPWVEHSKADGTMTGAASGEGWVVGWEGGTMSWSDLLVTRSLQGAFGFPFELEEKCSFYAIKEQTEY